MGLESSKRAALRFLETTVTGDIDGLDGLLAEDCRVFAAGDFATSGWKNKSQYDVGYVTAEDDRVCVEAEIHGPLSGGVEYGRQRGGTVSNAVAFVTGTSRASWKTGARSCGTTATPWPGSIRRREG